MKTLLKGMLRFLRCSAAIAVLAVSCQSALGISVGISSPADRATYTEPAWIYIVATNSSDVVMARLIQGIYWWSEDDSPPFAFYYSAGARICCATTVVRPSANLTGLAVNVTCADFKPGRLAVTVITPAENVERTETRLIPHSVFR